MNQRKLGNWQVAPLALGGNVFGWTVDDATGFKLLDAFVDAGFTLIDTADVYSRWVPGHRGGESETVIGRWLKSSGKRQKVLLATKLGKEMGPGLKGLSKKYILRAVEDSLRRLQTDIIDLYQSHEDDAQTPLEETLEAFGELIQQGKVRAIGASNFSRARLAESLEMSERHGLPRYVCLQPHYNLYQRAEYETELAPLCREKGLAVIPYFSLASGFLTGKYRSEADLANRARAQFVKKYLNQRGFQILAALDEAAKQQHSTPARVAIAWLMTRPGVTAPIASATSLEQLNDLFEAARLELDAASLERLNQASAYPVTPASE
jgi:aryl-alcohol dehydrogenase-like predicted oxidoreductase